MQVGIITIDGRQIGVVAFSTDEQSEVLAPTLASLGSEDSAGEPSVGALAGEGRHEHHGPGERDGGHAHRTHHAHHGERSRGEERPGRRFGGEGDTDPPARRAPLNLGAPSAVSGDRVQGRFAAARDRARRELEEKPWLNEKAMHIFAGENPHPEAATALWESAINRSAVRGTSLEKELRRHRSSGKDEGGYYAGWNSHISPEVRRTLEASRNRALNYSNVSGYATDNSSGDLAQREIASGSFQHRSSYNREHFFAPGHAEPAFASKWKSMVYESETVNAAEKARPAEKKAEASPDVKFDPETIAP